MSSQEKKKKKKRGKCRFSTYTDLDFRTWTYELRIKADPPSQHKVPKTEAKVPF